jgi:predicted RNA binding protein YcfA (HicA-like mRNA interferase family)
LPKLPRLTAQEAERILRDAGFIRIRVKGSHHIFQKGNRRIVIPFHRGKILHPKIAKQVFDCEKMDESSSEEKKTDPAS